LGTLGAGGAVTEISAPPSGELSSETNDNLVAILLSYGTARVLLAESGALFMTLDDHEVHHARVLMDELFDPENFLANITREKTQTPEGTESPFLETHTHVIAYARNAKIWRPNPSAGKAPTIWSAAEVGAHEIKTVAPSHPAVPYPLTPKPVGLLRRVLRIAADSDSRVLDPFAGSGATLCANFAMTVF